LKRNIVSTAFVIASIIARLAVVEVGARAYLAYVYLLGNYKSTATYVENDPRNPSEVLPIGWGKQNTTNYYYMFDEDSRIAWKSIYHINNAGLVSRNDYHADNPDNEYRVVIAGDSFTAALQMDMPWPDRLENMLNHDKQLISKLGGKTIRVYNLGMYSAGFPEYLDLAKAAGALHPDMIIVNYVSAAFAVCNKCNEAADTPFKDKERELLSGEIPIDADGQGKDIGYLKISCETLPIDFSNDTCRHSYSLILPPSLATVPSKVRKIKQEVVKRFLRGQLLTSLYPYSWDLVRGKMPSVTDLRHPEWFSGQGSKSRTLTEPEMIQQAADSLLGIQKLYPGKIVLATLNPTYDDLTWQPSEEMTKKLLSAYPDLTIKYMRKYLPQGRSADEMLTWYCLPHDGHMSDKGGEEYALAMERVISEALTR
jgi:hypothetical protein